jgi:hypothetical protein
MATYNEIIYSIREGIRQHTSDSDIDDRQIIFEFNLQRALWYRNEYNKRNKTIDDQAKQTICLNLVKSSADECGCNEDTDCTILKSVQKLPPVLDLHDKLAISKVTANDMVSKPLSFVSYNKFPFTGNGPYNKDNVFVTYHPNGHIYLKSSNPTFLLMNRIAVTLILEDPLDAKEFTCNEGPCFNPNKEYPVISHIISYIKDIVIKIFIQQLQVPKDQINNANEM